MSERSISKPASIADRPATECPPPRTATSSPCSRANRTAAITPAVPRQRRTSAGRFLYMPFQIRRASSYPASPGRATKPWKSAANASRVAPESDTDPPSSRATSTPLSVAHLCVEGVNPRFGSTAARRRVGRDPRACGARAHSRPRASGLSGRHSCPGHDTDRTMIIYDACRDHGASGGQQATRKRRGQEPPREPKRQAPCCRSGLHLPERWSPVSIRKELRSFDRCGPRQTQSALTNRPLEWALLPSSMEVSDADLIAAYSEPRPRILSIAQCRSGC